MTPIATGLTKSDYIDAVRANSAQLLDAAQRNMRAPVPSCPGWYVATLVAHIGEVQRFWALQVAGRAQEVQELPASVFEACSGLSEWLDGVDKGTPDLDAIPEGLIDWSREASEELIGAFEAVKPEDCIWHWSGDNRAIVHMRNQAMEATVHRWDAQNAEGVVTPIDEVIALDGIDQHFTVQIPAARKWGKPIDGSGESFHFHRTDGYGEWMVIFQGDQVSVGYEHKKADVAVRGTAEDIFLWLWGRIGADRLDVIGDRAVFERYRRLVPSST